MIESAQVIPEDLRQRSLFLVWGPPSHGPRSKVFARELGIRIEYVYATERRGLLVAPWKYTYQAVASLILLFRTRPLLVFIQSPPSFAVLFVWLYCSVNGARYVVDAHSAAMQLPWWTRPRWLYRFLARRALATIVTNEVFAEEIESVGGTALVLRDIPTSFPTGESLAGEDGFTVLVVNTFAFDEPLGEVLDAARAVPDVQFLITGNTQRGDRAVLNSASSNVRFTGFVPDADYYATMRASDAVMCLTTRDNTMQRGACEALSLGRPIITSDWPLLRDYFSKGTVHVAPRSESIANAIRLVEREQGRFREEISELQQAQRDEWTRTARSLATLIREGRRHHD